MSRMKNLDHTTCRNRILAEKSTGKRARLQMSTRKMERERYCELIWCSNVTWFICWTLIQNHVPHKMHNRRLNLFLCFFSSLFIQNHIIFHTKCIGGEWDQSAGVEEIFYRKTWISFNSWLVENNFWPPPIHMLELPGIHIWKYSSITREGISDDGLLL